MCGSDRVLVCSGNSEAYPTVQDQRLRAVQLLVSLPRTMKLPRSDRSRIVARADDPVHWVEASIELGGTRALRHVMLLASIGWCWHAETATGSIQVAGHGVPAEDIAIQPITNWEAYGIDLRLAQSSDALIAAARQAIVAWER